MRRHPPRYIVPFSFGPSVLTLLLEDDSPVPLLFDSVFFFQPLSAIRFFLLPCLYLNVTQLFYSRFLHDLHGSCCLPVECPKKIIILNYQLKYFNGKETSCKLWLPDYFDLLSLSKWPLLICVATIMPACAQIRPDPLPLREPCPDNEYTHHYNVNNKYS